MAKIALKGGAYTARSIIANAQRCVNLFPEKNPDDAEAPYTNYPTPGLRVLAQGNVAAVRGLYTASNGELFGAIGNQLVYIDTNWVIHYLGTLQTSIGTLVKMVDNSIDLVAVDGSPYGYKVNLSTHAFSPINDPSGLFVGADFVDYLDGFLIFNQPGTKFFYVSLLNQVAFNNTWFAQKTSQPDPLLGLIVKHREIWMVGSKTTEIWFNAGNTSGQPFSQMPGTFADRGAVAKYSIVRDANSISWLSRDERGLAMAMRTTQYAPARISNYAVEQEWSKYSTVEDCISFVYQSMGHTFIFYTFPTANATWVYDVGEELWHQRGWMNRDGEIQRHRANCFASAYGKKVVGDYENGKIYELSDTVYTDDGRPILRVRGFPHLVNDGKMMTYQTFMADLEVGFDANSVADNGPQIFLRWSDDKGATWGEPVAETIGATGEFLTTVTWNGLGFARDRVFEMFWSFDARTALQGAFIDAKPHKR